MMMSSQQPVERGVTTARCCGDRFYIDVTCRNAQRQGRLTGPKLVVSGIGMRAMHGHGFVGMPHTGELEFQKRSRENILKGVNIIASEDSENLE